MKKQELRKERRWNTVIHDNRDSEMKKRLWKTRLNMVDKKIKEAGKTNTKRAKYLDYLGKEE